MIYRKVCSTNLAGQPLPPKVVHRAVRDVVIGQGNHTAVSTAFVGAPSPGEIEIFHYPARTLAQFERKVRNGGSGYACNDELPAATGFHKREWYGQLFGGRLAREYGERMFFDGSRLRDALAAGDVMVDVTAAVRVAALPAFSGGAAATAR